MSPDRSRVILDTGVLVSWALRPKSVPAEAVLHAIDHAVVLMSEETLRELADVLTRPKFGPYIAPAGADEFIRSVADVAEFVDITAHVTGCRDPDDDKFLSLALVGEADLIVTGDRDLLELAPFKGIQIVTPRQYLNQREEQ